MSNSRGLSRRRVFSAAAAVPAAGALIAETALVQAATNPDARVAATVLRTSHSRTAERGLRVGLRVSILTAADSVHDLVVVVDPVDFHVSTDELRRQIVAGVQRQVQQVLGNRGVDIGVDSIAVQVFGGPL
jgi:hypothetical protein